MAFLVCFLKNLAWKQNSIPLLYLLFTVIKMENVEDEEIMCTPCQPNESCRTLLLTYSQADMDEVPYTATFAQLVLEACNEGTSSTQILKWAACQEPHADGGKHYHLIIRTSMNDRHILNRNGSKPGRPWATSRRCFGQVKQCTKEQCISMD